ncbi:hypothetical protein BDA99DRAFT_437917 [Phascolomyces articulosus]|uniref:PROP1-like PPR domain-containing protein n=1 Tax=Phascolomyces articulosus TaxID=60185 RepID=A0AAD5K0X2_9FUNG|nr:hypothetical protein BDA99DRAFT_437917 [Phascolomyces articulosus]
MEVVLLPTPPPSPLTAPQQLTCSDETRVAEERLLAAKREGNLKAVMAEFASIKRQGYTLSEQAYTIVLESHACLRREGSPLTQMLQVYEEMVKSETIQASGNTYSILIRALCKRDIEVQKTVAMLRRQSDRAGNDQHHHNDISSLQLEGNADKALGLFNTAIKENCVEELQVDVFNQLLRVFSHHGDKASALRVYDYMTRSNMPKTNITFAALVNLFGRSGDIESAHHYFIEFTKDTTNQPCCHVYSALVDAYLKCGLVQEALQVVRHDMPNDQVKVTTIPYNAIIRHYCARGEMDLAKQLLATMTVQPDSSSYGPILSAYCQQPDAFTQATDIYNALIKTDLSKAYGNLANYALLCLKHDRSDKALEVIEDMRMAGLEPDAVLSERIVNFFVHKNQVPEAIGALQQVMEAMSSRSLQKASGRLVQAATHVVECVVRTLDGRFGPIFTVVRAISSASSPSIPVCLARPLTQSYRQHPKERGCVSSPRDFHLLYEAALVLTEDELPFAEFVLDLVSTMRISDNGLVLSQDIVLRVLSRLQVAGDTKAAAEWKAAFDPHSLSMALSPTTAATPMTALSSSSSTNTHQEEGQKSSLSTADILSKDMMRAVVRGDIGEAVSILRDQIVLASLVPSPEPMRDAIALAGKQGHLDEAQNMYSLSIQAFQEHFESQRAQRAVYMATNSILIGYAQQGNMEEAKKYYDQIKKMGHYPDGNAYASLLLGTAQSASTTDEATDALIIYDEAKRHHVKPTTFFYNVVISKLAKARKLEPALRLFDEMQRLFKLTPNAITYGAVISACVRAGSEAHAVRLFDEMLQLQRQEPRIGPFNNMIQFYVRQQPNRERALSYFQEMRRRHISPSAHTYKLLMEVYCMMAPYDMDKAHELLKEMQDKDHMRPQPTHYATLIYAYGTIQNNVEAAQKVFQQVSNNKGRHHGDEEVVYQAMLDTLIRNDRLDQAEKVYDQMCRKINKSSSPYIENLLLRGYGEKGFVNKAEALFERMSDDKSSPAGVVVREPSTYEAMVRAYVENSMINKAKSILDRMVRRQFPEKVVASVAALIFE